MLDVLVGYVLLGLAIMGLLQIVVVFMKLRNRSLCGALVRLVDASGPPKGFLSHVLVERALADPKVDAESPGAKGPTTAVRPSGRITWVGGDAFAQAARDALSNTDVKLLVDGLSVRPPAIQQEVKQEVTGLADRLAARVTTHFDRAMAGAADGYKGLMRWLAILFGVPAAAGLFFSRGGNLEDDVFLLVIGLFVVPICAGMWYGFLKGPMKLRPEAESPVQAASTAPKSRGGRRPARAAKSPAKSNSGPAKNGPSDASTPAQGGRGGQRRRRRPSGRRGGRSGGSGGKPGGGGGGGSGGGGEGS